MMITPHIWRALSLLVFTTLGLAACSTTPPAGVTPVTGFELTRYSGKWYEIARLDHSFERGLDNVTARYTPQANGTVEVLNRGYDSKEQKWHDATGTARFNGASDVGSLKVSFFGPFYGGYHIVALDPDYRWAMIIGPNPGYLWILAREPKLPDNIRQQLLQQAKTLGVDTQQLIWVEQNRQDS
ncbi:lipocalin family protein [Neisseriaceae bacterium TC5R-5]|nr:lipocalin family protein [Neisseriaceae bacterium TC5R-5]